MRRRRRFSAHPGLLALLLGFGLFLFYWPYLQHPQEWRQPATVIYLFAAWTLVIFLIFLASRGLRPRGRREHPPASSRPVRED